MDELSRIERSEGIDRGPGPGGGLHTASEESTPGTGTAHTQTLRQDQAWQQHLLFLFLSLLFSLQCQEAGPSLRALWSSDEYGMSKGGCSVLWITLAAVWRMDSRDG